MAFRPNRYRTHTCGELRESDIGKDVRLSGWISTIRNHGGIVFVDLTDFYGVTQVVVTDEQIRDFGKETVILVRGKVLKRDEETVNPNIDTGLVEVKAEKIELLGSSLTNLPFRDRTLQRDERRCPPDLSLSRSEKSEGTGQYRLPFAGYPISAP